MADAILECLERLFSFNWTPLEKSGRVFGFRGIFLRFEELEGIEMISKLQESLDPRVAEAAEKL